MTIQNEIEKMDRRYGGVRDTSLQAFDKIMPRIGTMQNRVLAALKKHGAMCNRRLARILNMEINSITPRVKELRDLGLVIDAGVERFEKKNVHVWKVRTIDTLF